MRQVADRTKNLVVQMSVHGQHDGAASCHSCRMRSNAPASVCVVGVRIHRAPWNN